jgi:hypothetical protein
VVITRLGRASNRRGVALEGDRSLGAAVERCHLRARARARARARNSSSSLNFDQAIVR